MCAASSSGRDRPVFSPEKVSAPSLRRYTSKRDDYARLSVADGRGQGALSARALNWAWQQHPATTPQKLVLAALADRADDEGVCWPSTAWLARKCSPLSTQSVRRALTDLADQGLLLKVKRQRRKDGTLSVWLLQLPLSSHQGLSLDGADQSSSVIGPVIMGDTAEPSIEPSIKTTKTDVLVPRSRDYGFEFVVSVKGEPLPRQRSAYGRVAADLNALLDRDGVSGTARLSELRRRHEALCRLWGEEKSGPRSLVEHWPLSGNAASGHLGLKSNGGVSARELLVEAAREAGL